MKKTIMSAVVLLTLFASVALFAHSDAQVGGAIVNFGSFPAYLAEIQYTSTDTTTSVHLPKTYGPPSGMVAFPWVAVANNTNGESIYYDIDNYVDFGDGSTVAPDGDGGGIHVGLNDPEFEWTGSGSPTTAYMVEVVVLSASTYKDRITLADPVDPTGTIGTTWGSYSGTMTMSTVHDDLGCGIGLEWTASGGHTAADTWYIKVYPDDEFDGGTQGGLSVVRVDLDGNDTLTTDGDITAIFFWNPFEMTW